MLIFPVAGCVCGCKEDDLAELSTGAAPSRRNHSHSQYSCSQRALRAPHTCQDLAPSAGLFLQVLEDLSAVANPLCLSKYSINGSCCLQKGCTAGWRAGLLPTEGERRSLNNRRVLLWLCLPGTFQVGTLQSCFEGFKRPGGRALCSPAGSTGTSLHRSSPGSLLLGRAGLVPWLPAAPWMGTGSSQ